MSAPSKRRRIHYYLSLPVVVAVVLLLVAKLVAMQRAEIIAELSDRVEHRDPEDASAAVRQLGEMPHPPASVLVAAAATPDRKVAREAQHTISKILRRAHQQLEAGRGTKAVARQLTELARELADQRHAFPVADHAWLVSTMQRILHLANQVPPKHAPVVAANCDIILTSIPNAMTAAGPQDDPRNVADHIPPSGEDLNSPESVPWQNRPDDGESAHPSTDDSLVAPWRGEWSRPVFRTLPPSPADARPIPPDTSPLVPSHPNTLQTPTDAEVLSRPLADIDTRTLLQNWLAAEDREATTLQNELANRRGFGRLHKPLVQKLFSNPQDRLQLVDDVLSAPGVNSRPWLILLAADRDADVRLAAVTLMATSTDAALVEEAWQAAIHDRDPRVAALANRLRERRTATQRR